MKGVLKLLDSSIMNLESQIGKKIETSYFLKYPLRRTKIIKS